MSSECEQVFNKASYTISACQSNPSQETIEGKGDTSFAYGINEGIMKISAPVS